MERKPLAVVIITIYENDEVVIDTALESGSGLTGREALEVASKACRTARPDLKVIETD